jgi:hypothetical protein
LSLLLGSQGRAYPTGETKKVKSKFPFYFPKVPFNSHWNLDFLKMQKMKNQICCGKGEKMVDFLEGENRNNANCGRKAEKSNMK